MLPIGCFCLEDFSVIGQLSLNVFADKMTRISLNWS